MRTVKWLCVIIVSILVNQSAFSQQLRLGKSPYTVEKSAVLELVSDNQGLLLPRITDTSLINSLNPPDGMIIFYAPDKKLLIRSNNLWKEFAEAGSVVTSVGSGYGLIGGPITTTGSLVVDTGTLSNYWMRRQDSTLYYPYASNPKSYLTSSTIPLASTQVPYGNGSNFMTSSSGLTFNSGTNTLSTTNLALTGYLLDSWQNLGSTGNSQGNAASITTGLVSINAGGISNQGIILPTPTAVGQIILVNSNQATTTKNVYPHSGGNINGGTMNTPITIPLSSTIGFVAVSSSEWDTYITPISATSPITYNASTNAIGITQSSTSTDGYLSSIDWNTFNNKLSSVDTSNISNFYLKVRGLFSAGTGISYNSTTGVIANSGVVSLNGNAGALIMDTSYISNFYLKVRALHSVSSPLTYNSSTGAIGITQSGASNDGYLSSTDWNTFNTKQSSGNYLPDPGGNGVIVRTALNTTTNRTITGTSNRIDITNGDGVSGNPTIDISTSYVGQNTITTLGTISTGTWNGIKISEAYGGTNQSTYTLGDILYASAANTLSKLAGNTTATKKFLTQTGNGSISAAPAWSTLSSGDIPDLSGTYLVKSNNLSDLSSVATSRTNLGATTIGSNIFTLTNPSAAGYLRTNADNTITHRTYANVKVDLGLDNVENTALSTWAGSTNLTTLGTITTGTWNGTKISEVYGGTNQSTYTLGDILYSSAANTLSKLPGNITSAKKFLSQTGTGAVSAAPSWITLSGSDVGLGNVENTALSTWAGSTNLITLGTITTGTWNGSILSGSYGGTGVNNGAKTITLGNNFTTSGNYALTLTQTGITNVTLPTSGTLATLSGTETFNNKTLDNTNSLTIKDANLTLQNSITTSKQVQFDLSSISAATTRTWTFPDASTTFVGTGTTQTLTNKTFTSSTNVLGGVTMTLGSDAAGDIYYRNNSGVLTRLGIGSNGQFLNISSGVPTWITSGSAFSPHNLLSAIHSDVTAASVVRGDIITGQGATPTWSRLAIGSQGQILQAGANEVGYTSYKLPTSVGTAGQQLRANGTDYVNKTTTTYQATPADPSTTSSTTGVMMGLAGSITPAYSGTVMIIISGDIDNNGNNNGAQVQIRYGTGTAPTNGAALTGTTVGGLIKFNENNSSIRVPFQLNAIVTGLAVGTAYWIDVSLAAISAGTARIRDISISAVEY